MQKPRVDVAKTKPSFSGNKHREFVPHYYSSLPLKEFHSKKERRERQIRAIFQGQDDPLRHSLKRDEGLIKLP